MENTWWRVVFHYANKFEMINRFEISLFHKYCAYSVFRPLCIRRPAKPLKKMPIEDKERKVSLDPNKGVWKKWLKEIHGDKTSMKQQLSNIKKKILVISRAENERKQQIKKEKLDALSIRTHLYSPKTCWRNKKIKFLMYQKKLLKRTYKENIPIC